jgi:DNA-binding transcriptional LysR family regulator
MTIESLKYFVSIIDSKSISKAAEIEHISQSALTQSIKRLESDFKCDLLHRTNKGIEPTESGILVYEYAKDILAMSDSLKSRLMCLNEGCYNIVIKPCCSMDNHFIPTIVFQLQSKFPGIKLTTELDSKLKTLTEIQVGIADFGIVMGHVSSHPMLDVEIIGFEQIVLIAHQKSPINQLTVNDLINYKLIDFTLASYLKDIHQKLASLSTKNASSGYLPFLSLDSISSIKSLIMSNLGFAFLPKYSVTEELLSQQFKIIKIEGFNYNLPIKIVSKTNDALTEMMRGFKSSLIKTAKKYFLEKEKISN